MKSFSELTSASQVNNGDLVAISQTSGSGYASKKTTVKDNTDKSNLNLAEEYDSTSTYAVDDYVIYESVLYKCIGTTTGTFDSTKWTSVVVTDEMGSGGGGGTGGHTIIDENGNLMTARSGLQFVGGANVSDDSTNNKTIVDVASAGGIDGVFIDTDNVIQASTAITSSADVSYTATEDCVILFAVVGATGNSADVKINDIKIWEQYLSGSVSQFSSYLFVKKGQTVKFHQTFSSTNGYYIVYGIQTGTTHSKFQPVIYSTEEREIGVWTDGKPLYEKTFDLGSDTDISYNSWTETTISWQTISVERLVGAKGFTSSGGTFAGTLLASKKSNGKVEIQTPRNNFNSGVRYLTLQYTKSTDVAGSGSWTPQGVPTHHYTLMEKIVGTWLDKTLYEKTIDCGTMPNATTKTVAHGISNVDTIINIEGYAKNTNNGVCVKLPHVYNDATFAKSLMIYADATNITLKDTENLSVYTESYVTLRYTKSS